MAMMTLEQIRAKGLRALVQELGTVGAVRFLQSIETGRGNYVRERRKRMTKQSVQSLVKQIEARRTRAAA
jgi:hypothetical protein